MFGLSVARIQIYPKVVVNDAWEGSKRARRSAAGQIAAIARSTTPVSSGDYRSSFSVATQGNIVRVVSSDPDAIYKEYGTSRARGVGTLTAAAAAVGANYKGFRPRVAATGLGRRKR